MAKTSKPRLADQLEALEAAAERVTAADATRVKAAAALDRATAARDEARQAAETIQQYLAAKIQVLLPDIGRVR